MRLVLAVLSATLLALSSMQADGPAADGAPRPAVPQTAPAAERCADCHPQVVANYSRTGMARALGPLEPGELSGLESVAAGDSGFHYRFEESAPDEDGSTEARLVETWRPEGGDASEEVSRSARVAFAVGAGNLDRSYVLDDHDRMWFAPLEVLSADGAHPRRAALAPGHSITPTLRFESPIAEECLACHTDQLPPRDYPLNRMPDEASEWEPRGISCGACHGDVVGHALWRERELSGGRPSGRDPILDLESMDLVERLSVCARCHLQGDARIALRPGERGVPPPGGDFLERWAVYVPEEPDGAIGFVSQVERMTASPCFVLSLQRDGPQMSCEVCHDPHKSLWEPRERQRVRAGCLTCHEVSENSAKGSACSMPREERADYDCVGCHMRSTEVFDLAHIRIHDHKIERELSPSDHFESIRIKHTEDGKLRAFSWPGHPPPSYAEDAGLKMMAAFIAGFPEEASTHMSGLSSPEVRKLPTYLHLRGILLEMLVRFDEAKQAYQRALRIDPDQHESKINLALLLGNDDEAAEGLRMLDELLEEFPQAANALRNRAVLRYATGNAMGFSADLEAALAILPRGPVARALSSWYAERGMRDLARKWADEARRLDPHLQGGR